MSDSRRNIIVPINQLKYQVEEAEDAISDIIYQAQDLVISDFETNPDNLTLFAAEFRSRSNSFESLSKSYAKRLSKEGSFQESNQAISLWHEKSEKISLIKLNLTGMLRSLNLDTFSSWCNGSTRSGFSMASQLEEQQSSYEASPPMKSITDNIQDQPPIDEDAHAVNSVASELQEMNIVSMPSVNLFSNVVPSNVNRDICNSNVTSDIVTFRNVIDRISDVGERENVGDKHIYSKTNTYKSLLDFSTHTTPVTHDCNTTQFFSPSKPDLCDPQNNSTPYTPDINVPSTLIDNTVTSGNIVTLNSVQPDMSKSSFTLKSSNLPVYVSLDRARRHEPSNYCVKPQMVPSESSLLSDITGGGPSDPRSMLVYLVKRL